MISKNKLGLAFGAFFGVWHLMWAVLVAFGVAQWFINFVFRIHFMQPPYTVKGFELALAITLILVTSIIGYVMGWALAGIWNWLQAKKQA